jgi:hypothetical protein
MNRLESPALHFEYRKYLKTSSSRENISVLFDAPCAPLRM